jgi:peptide/nickel transport system substrate-binding protein
VMKPRWLRVLALFLGLSMIAAACGGDDDTSADNQGRETEETTEGDTDEGGDEAASGGTVVFANDQEPDGWNINTASSNLLALGQLTELVFPSAFRTTPDFEVVMDENLLESAELTSEDPQVVEYVINPDAVWSDGTPITADDFRFQWQMMNGSNPDVDTASTTGYDRIESIEGSEDGKTVTVTFAEPYAEWKALFANILPAHIIPTLAGAGGDDEAAEGNEDDDTETDTEAGETDTGDDGPPSQAAVAGWNDGLDGENVPEFSGGPFMFEDYRPEQSVTLVPNPEYWGPQPNLDELVIRFDVDNAGIPAALENGEIDMAYPQPQLDLVDQIDSIEGVESQTSFGLSFEHIDFNLNNSHLAKPEVRKAIAHALDEEDVVARTVGQFSDEASVLQNRIWLSNQPQYEAHGDEYLGANVEEARSLLEEAGYDCSGDVCTHPEDGDLSLSISTTGGNQLRENTQLVLQNQLSEAGIQLSIDNVEGGAVFEKFFPESNLVADQDYDIALFAWVGTPFPSANKALYSTEDPTLVNSNNTNYQNPEIVEVFDQALVETDEDAAADLYNQADEILWEDMPTVPLYQKPTYLPYRTSIQNVEDNASTAGPLWNAYEWRISD